MTTVTRETPTSRCIWTFGIIHRGTELSIVLEAYVRYERSTPKGRWAKSHAVEGYRRLRSDPVPAPRRIEVEPDVPEDVVEEGVRQVRDLIVFRKWERS